MIVTLDSFRCHSPQGFVVIEGVNGAGKSTVIAAVEKHLQEVNRTTIRTWEPGDTPLGKELRRLLLNSPQLPRHSTAELLLFGADRSEHVDAVIKPALGRGDFVLCDRYLYSTIAFQGYGRQLDMALISQVNEIAIKGTLPDLVILLDLDAHEGLRRTRSRQNSAAEGDSFELETIEFHNRIREGFLTLARERPEPFLVIDAHQPVEAVITAVLNAIDVVLKGASLV